MDGQLNDQHKNTTAYGWMDRELNGWHWQLTINRCMEVELNDQHKNTTAYGWMDRELNGWHRQNETK